MKITLPAIRRETVGFTYIQAPNRYYSDPQRPNVYNSPVYKDLIETKLTTATVFDRDLRVAYRADKVARIAALLVIAPVLTVACFAYAFALRVAGAAVDTFFDAAELVTYSVDGVRELARKAVAG